MRPTIRPLGPLRIADVKAAADGSRGGSGKRTAAAWGGPGLPTAGFVAVGLAAVAGVAAVGDGLELLLIGLLSIAATNQFVQAGELLAECHVDFATFGANNHTSRFNTFIRFEANVLGQSRAIEQHR